MLYSSDNDEIQNYKPNQQDAQHNFDSFTMDHSYQSSQHQLSVNEDINKTYETNSNNIEDNYNNDEFTLDSNLNDEPETIEEMISYNEEHLSNDSNINRTSSDQDQSEICLNPPNYNYEYLKSDSDEDIELKPNTNEMQYNFTENVDNDDYDYDVNARNESISQLSKPLQISHEKASINFTKRKYFKRKCYCTKNAFRIRSLQSTKLFRMQFEVLKAKKQKLLEETEILRLTKEKLIAELNEIRNNSI